jgi:hypothetical protein
VRLFLDEADRRIERFLKECRVPGFVPCDFVRTYEVLRAMSEHGIAPGNHFCEWGSGFGVVSCLAAMLDFDACGVEIERELVDAACQLASDFELPVEFLHGSFIPEGSDECLDVGGGYAWLITDVGGAQDEAEYAPEDFDVIFVYPWPDEEQVMAALFERHAGTGAVLVSYHGLEGVRLRRKVGRKRRRAQRRTRSARRHD